MRLGDEKVEIQYMRVLGLEPYTWNKFYTLMKNFHLIVDIFDPMVEGVKLKECQK